METLRLTIATHDYDHVQDLVSGAVRPQGITLVPLNYRPHELFYRFMTHGEWEVSEMTFGGYCASVADGTANCVAIPVFPSRVFRQSGIFVRDDGMVIVAGGKLTTYRRMAKEVVRSAVKWLKSVSKK